MRMSLVHVFNLCSLHNLQDADKKGLSKIAEEVKQLAQKARENSLKPEDYEVKFVFWLKLEDVLFVGTV